MSSFRGLNQHQAGALVELTKLCARDELEVQLRGGLDGSVLATVRDPWSVEHFRLDRYGVITRPVAAGAAPPQGVPQV